MTIEETKKYFEGFPEAPASDSFKWVDEQGFEHLSTIRAWHFKPLLAEFKEAQMEILAIGGRPATTQRKPTPTATKIQERDETGTPVIDGEGKPVMVDLPQGAHLFTVKKVYHGKTQTGKDFVGIITEEKPYSIKWGVKCFHPPFADWKNWEVGDGEPNYMAMPIAKKHVIIRDPEGEGKYPEVLEFRD
jgi:hypothetical protein